MGDPDLVVELAQLFVESTQPILVEMREALARGDSAAVARTAHSVKGASANMFVTHLVKAAAALEVAGKAGDLSAMLTLVDDVERHFAEAAAYLRTELSF
jgi:HPt (histidine-containing phosphotransfer) domain-containing protein